MAPSQAADSQDDPFELARFVEAQDAGGTYEHALSELREGRKRSHWMWFVFPQLAGLGRSEMARRYAIGSLAEARAYVVHPVLGRRLADCARALRELPGDAGAKEILGAVDALKLRSSMTLFARAVQPGNIYEQVLERYFDGRHDELTDARI